MSDLDSLLHLVNSGTPMIIRTAERGGVLFMRAYAADAIWINHENNCPRICGAGDALELAAICNCQPKQVLEIGATLLDTKMKSKWIVTIGNMMRRFGMLEQTDHEEN